MMAPLKTYEKRGVFLCKLVGSSLVCGGLVAILFKFLLYLSPQGALYVIPPVSLLFGFWVAPQLNSISLVRALFLTVEAALCSEPCVAAVLFSPLWVLLGFISSVRTGEFSFAIVLFGCFFSLFEFWRLTVLTAERQSYQFRRRFFMAVGTFLIASIYFSRMYPARHLALLFIPPVLATLHFFYEQKRIEKTTGGKLLTGFHDEVRNRPEADLLDSKNKRIQVASRKVFPGKLY